MELEILRMGERILVVSGGILCVYLGYRLFEKAHVGGESNAKLSVKDVVDFGVSRVGPGFFFALFGAWVLYSSLSHTVQIDRPDPIAWSGSPTPTSFKELELALAALEAKLPSMSTDVRKEFEPQIGKLSDALKNLKRPGIIRFEAYEPRTMPRGG